MPATPNYIASSPIHFVSLNAKGMNTWIKRQKILSYLQHLRSDVIFLQETHLKNNHVNYLKRGWVGQVFHSQFNAKAWGTAILIHKDIPFQAKEVITDTNGRFVIVSGQLFASPVILVNIYAPNYDDASFFVKLFSNIPSDNNYNLIIGGGGISTVYLTRYWIDHQTNPSSSLNLPEQLMIFPYSMVSQMFGDLNLITKKYSLSSPMPIILTPGLTIFSVFYQYASSPSPPLFKERMRLQTEYNLLSTDKAAYLLTKAQFNVYDSGDKAGKLLAQQARQTFSSCLIPKIRSETGELVTSHKGINNAFKQYYHNLYSSECDGNLSQLQSFFDKLTLPSVLPDQTQLLGGEITDAEILQAIKSLRCNKTPGPDGYISEFYKKFALQLCPLLRVNVEWIPVLWSSSTILATSRNNTFTKRRQGLTPVLILSSHLPSKYRL